jgi:lipopolysaccharide export system protein LptA
MTDPHSPHASTRSRPALIALVVCLAMSLAQAALAEKADRDKPINFESDTGGAQGATNTGELAGHVIVTQGTLTIHADRITFRQNPDNSLSATAYGNPVSFREKRDGADDYYEGFAQRIVYDGTTRLVELFDRALLRKTGDEIRSNYISYNAGTEVFHAEGRPDTMAPPNGELPLGPRVRGSFLPKSDEKPEKASPKDKSGDKAAPTKDIEKGAAAQKGAAASPPGKGAAAPPLTLQPSGDLAPAK